MPEIGYIIIKSEPGQKSQQEPRSWESSPGVGNGTSPPGAFRRCRFSPHSRRSHFCLELSYPFTWPILARNVDPAGPVFKPAVTPCRRPFNCPPARAASIQPPPQWALQSPIAQQASYSFNWCWWPSVPSFRSEQVSRPRPLPCCSHRSTILRYQKVHWIPITQLILPRRTYWELQGPFRLGWSLTSSSPVSRSWLRWRRRSWYHNSLPTL